MRSENTSVGRSAILSSSQPLAWLRQLSIEAFVDVS